MSNQEIIKYINQCRDKNIVDDVIKGELLKAGWAEGDVNEAFNSFLTSIQEATSQPWQTSEPKKLMISLIALIIFGFLALSVGVWGVLYYKKQQTYNENLDREYQWELLTVKNIRIQRQINLGQFKMFNSDGAEIKNQAAEKEIKIIKYTIKEGDTINGIFLKFGVDSTHIAAANPETVKLVMEDRPWKPAGEKHLGLIIKAGDVLDIPVPIQTKDSLLPTPNL